MAEWWRCLAGSGQMHVQSDTRVQTWAHTCTHVCTCSLTDARVFAQMGTCATMHTTCANRRAHTHTVCNGDQASGPTLSRPCPLPPSGSGRCFPEQWGCRLPPSPALWHHLHQGQAAEPGQNRATCFARGHGEPQACARWGKGLAEGGSHTGGGAGWARFRASLDSHPWAAGPLQLCALVFGHLAWLKALAAGTAPSQGPGHLADTPGAPSPPHPQRPKQPAGRGGRGG